MKPTIAMVIPSLSSGGAEKVFVTLAKGFSNLGYRVVVITFTTEKDVDFFALDKVIERRHLSLLQASSNPLSAIINNIRRVWRLRRELKSVSPKVVVSFLTETNIVALMSSLGLAVPVVICEHTNPKSCPMSISWSLLRNITYRFCTRLVLLSPQMSDFYPVSVQQNIVVIPNPVERPELNQIVEYGSEISTLVTVGRLGEEKNQQLLIDAFANLSLEYPRLTLRFIGDGPLRAELEALSKSLELTERIEFSGILANPWANIAVGESIFVLSSTFEGFPMALCEAMAAGLPVITTEYHAGVKDIIVHGGNGLLVPINDSSLMANQIRHLLDTPEQRQLMARNAVDIVTKFGTANVVDRWQSLFAEVIRYD